MGWRQYSDIGQIHQTSFFIPLTIGLLIFIVLDNDKRETEVFKKQLEEVAVQSMISLDHVFCIAVEEMEAWLLGDQKALLCAYPKAKESVLKEYKQDSICGTWEVLANAVYKGGLKKMKRDCLTYHEVFIILCRNYG